MTELSTYGAGVHETGVLRVSKGGHSTEGTDVLRTLRSDMIGGSTLKASDHDGSGRGRVRDLDGMVAGSGSHNHFQSSGESNASSVHCRSSSSVNSRPTSLSLHCISSILFSS